MNIVKYTPFPPPNYEAVAEGQFRAQMEPVLAELLLKIPNGEYVVRELQAALIRAIKDNPRLVNTHDLEGQLYYGLGAAQGGADFGTTVVPFQLFARNRNL